LRPRRRRANLHQADFFVDDLHLSVGDAKEAVELFIVNARDIGLLRTLSGAERIVTLDHMLDLLPAATSTAGLLARDTTGVHGAAPQTVVGVVHLDMTDIYSFVPRMEGWRAELTQHARQALEQPSAVVTPINYVARRCPNAAARLRLRSRS
jgi:hypothetical protein